MYSAARGAAIRSGSVPPMSRVTRLEIKYTLVTQNDKVYYTGCAIVVPCYMPRNIQGIREREREREKRRERESEKEREKK